MIPKAYLRSDLLQEISTRGLPACIKLFDIHINPNGSMLFFVVENEKRTTIALAPGDDHVGRFLNLIGDIAMAKEIGLKKGASAKAKAYDKAQDKKLGLREGSPEDIRRDKAAMKKFPAKKGR